jgi:CheY-like chemotaxis protein
MATVLVVDDEDSIVDLLADVVSDAGHTALTATNAFDALELARCHHPTLVISDVMMPLMDGYALVKALQADPTLADTMIILMSAGFREDQAQLGTAMAFIPKPLDLNMIEHLLPRLP